VATFSQPDPLSRGSRAGIERVSSYGLATEPEVARGAIDTAQRLIEQQALDASDRFLELFGELIVIAAMARLTYQEPALSPEEIDSYLGHSVAFFNSFRHA
jgi:hypothetical protein